MAVHIANNRIDGLRITIYDVLHYLEAGRSHEEIASILPLTVEQVAGAAHYIEDHRDIVLAAHREIETRISHGNSPTVTARAQVGRARMEALRNGKNHAASTEGNGEGTAGGR